MFFLSNFDTRFKGGALIFRAEIKPIEPVRIMPERENEDFSSTLFNLLFNKFVQFVFHNSCNSCFIVILNSNNGVP